MALRALMISKNLEDAKKKLEGLRAKSEEFATREAELEQAISEASTEEEKQAVEAAVAEFEADKEENAQQIASLEKECEDLERELKETESKTSTPPPAAEGRARKENKQMEAVATMSTRARELFGKMDVVTRTEFIQSPKAQEFLAEVRTCISQKRALSNAGLLCPQEWLGLIRENVTRYSKLYRHVRIRPMKGTGRQTIMGQVPEAVWTEACAKVNELDIAFSDVEFDGYKVAGFIPVCNATLEDSEIDLAAEIITALGEAIGKALDKAILYGKGIKMPLGIATRLCQASEPGNYPTNARPWQNLTSHVITISAALTGVQFYKALTKATGKAKGKYSRGEKVWCMNETTYTNLKAEMLTINASGAVVSGIEGTLPVIGGIVEVLDFMPDNVILGGYMDLYTAAERAGTKVTWSEHCRFLESETVFLGEARYDGAPVIPEGFVLIGLEGTTPTADMLFAPDEANAIQPDPVTISVLAQSDTVYGETVSNLQSADTALNGDTFYGTLKYVTTGPLISTWGAGYFLAVDFSGVDFGDNLVRVGLVPTAGTGFGTVTSDDHKSIFKITDPTQQILKTTTTKDGNTVAETYSLAGLTLEATGA